MRLCDFDTLRCHTKQNAAVFRWVIGDAQMQCLPNSTSGLLAARGTFNYCTQLLGKAPPPLRIQLRLQARDLGVCLFRILVKYQKRFNPQVHPALCRKCPQILPPGTVIE